jgi:poly(3-hydroxybutyrate) depolymerase
VTTAAMSGLPSIQVSYKVYVPSGYVFDPQRPVPLVVTELTPYTYWQSISESDGFIVAEQQGYLGNGGFTLDYDPLVLQALLTDVEATWNIDVKRVYLTGFSAGAHWSYAIGLSNADLFAALGICSGSIGLAIQENVWIQDATTQPNVPRVIPVSIRQGTQDTVVPPYAGQFSRDQLLKASFPVDYAEFQDGHTVSTAELQGMWDYLKLQSLP